MIAVERTAEVIAATARAWTEMPPMYDCEASELAQALADAGLLCSDTDRAVLNAALEEREAEILHSMLVLGLAKGVKADQEAVLDECRRQRMIAVDEYVGASDAANLFVLAAAVRARRETQP